jgi:hypothetical protein
MEVAIHPLSGRQLSKIVDPVSAGQWDGLFYSVRQGPAGTSKLGAEDIVIARAHKPQYSC